MGPDSMGMTAREKLVNPMAREEIPGVPHRAAGHQAEGQAAGEPIEERPVAEQGLLGLEPGPSISALVELLETLRHLVEGSVDAPALTRRQVSSQSLLASPAALARVMSRSVTATPKLLAVPMVAPR